MGVVHGVSASHADDDGRLKYMCLQNSNPSNTEGLHVFQLHAALTPPRLSPSLADTPCTIYHGSDVLLIID